MKTSRKQFITTGVSAIFAGTFSNKLTAQSYAIPNTGSKEVAFNDEKYWHTIRQLFPLSKDLIYLNNGTMGPSPYPVIEAVKKGMMDGDQILA